MKARIWVTIAVLAAWWVIVWGFRIVSPIDSAALAVHQFDNSNVSYGVSQTYRFFTGTLPTILLFAVLLKVWWRPLKGLFVPVLLMCVAASIIPAHAYYDKQNWTEVYFILPNESAFFIPDVGANKEGQSAFGSEAYLRENKIAAKRFEVPHVKIPNSAWLSDYYVPAGRLIIVDRTPYNREWTASADRGTSPKNEAFPCQTNEGINVTAEVSIATSVTEDNAPRFLFWFGVKPPLGDRTKPETIFASVFLGRTLTEVMDGVIRGKIQQLVASEISSRTLDQANAQMPIMLANIEKAARAFLESRGITLDYIGWAGTFTFDKDVQQAINDRYSAAKIEPVLPVLRTKAVLDAMARWNGQLPTSLSGLWLLPLNIWDGIQSWLTLPKPMPRQESR